MSQQHPQYPTQQQPAWPGGRQPTTPPRRPGWWRRNIGTVLASTALCASLIGLFTPAVAVSAVVGPQGPQGIQGEQGPAGKPGKDGQAAPAPAPVPAPVPAPAPEPAPEPAPATSEAVTRVIDGDTIVVGTERVRLLGIDAPETGECYARDATLHLNHVAIGKQVQLEPDPSQDDRDRYGRLLRYVRMPSGTNLNRYMIGEGYAHEYTYDAAYKHQAAFKSAEDQARAAEKGLWGACSTSPAPAPEPAPEPAPSPEPPAGPDKDCADFASQEEAQGYFDARGGSATNNVDGLDGNDHDGIVCESL
jgi:endonuclease YncB( thermonuclease family)